MIRPNFRDFSGGSTIIIHSAKGSVWKEHIYIKKIDGTYYYPKDYKGGGRKVGGPSDKASSTSSEDSSTSEKTSENSSTSEKSSSTNKDEILNKIEDYTGMQRKYVEELYEVAKTKGFDSDEYKELCLDLAEGREDRADSITNMLKSEKTSESTGSSGGSADRAEAVSKVEDYTGMQQKYIEEAYDVGRTKGFDSYEYANLCRELAEGDEDRAKKINEMLGGPSSTSGKLPPEVDNKDDMISQIEDYTGMQRKYVEELYEISRSKGFDSFEYRDECFILAEGDEDRAKKISEILGKSSSSTSESDKDDEPEGYEVTKDDYEDIAREVIRGSFGNGETRKELLGEHYSEVQSIVNKMLNGTYVKSKDKITEDDYEYIARAVIRGEYGNGEKRKELLGEHYSGIQSIVNQMLKKK